MKFGFRIPSLTKRIAARTSLKLVIRHNLGFKAPKGFGWFTNPKKSSLQQSLQQNITRLFGQLTFLGFIWFSNIFNPFLRFQEIG